MYKYRQKKLSYLKKIFIVILIILSVIFTGYSVKKERNLTFVESVIKDTTTFLCEVMYEPIKFLKNKLQVNKEKENIYKKYKVLEQEEKNLEQKNARITELEKENKELKELMDIKSSLLDYDKVNAAIVNRNVGYWYDKFTINKGEKDGIKTKMAVINNSGIIGYISETSYYTSNVQLLTTKNVKNKISVKIELGDNKYANGILIGYDQKKKVYKIEGISYQGKITNDSKVTTTGLSDLFPSGILIGFVESTTTDNFDLGKIVEVRPSVDFDDINYVSVLVRKD